MTNYVKNQAIELLNELVQEEINGRKYFTFEDENIDHCGGHQIVIKNVVLLHDHEIMAIIAVCNKYCLQFKLYLNEGKIILL